MTDTRTPPKLTRPTFHVWLEPEDDPIYHHVVVNAGDQLRAELEAKAQGLAKPQDAPMHLSLMWLWAALVRTGRYTENFRKFKTECLAYDKDAEGDEDLDPTDPSTS